MRIYGRVAAVAAFLGVSTFAISAPAQVISGDWGEISASAGAMTDYVFRGVSQTKNGPAVQGSAEYARSLGPVTPYFGLFLSNTRFPDTSSRGNLDVKYELDISFGVRGDIAGKLKWDVGYLRYYYPFADMPPAASQSFDWSEGYGKLAYDFGFATVLGGYFHSPNYSVAAGKGHYFNGGVDVPLPFYDITMGGRIGRLIVKNNANLGLPDYTDWSLGVSRDFPELLGLNIALTYYDTNVKKNAGLSNDSDGATGNVDERIHDTTRPRVVLAVTKKF